MATMVQAIRMALHVGEVMSLGKLTSFTESSKIADHFIASPESIQSMTFYRDGVMIPTDAYEYNNFKFVIQGPHKSVSVDAHNVNWKEKEHLTHGKFEVVKVEEGDPNQLIGGVGKYKGVPYSRIITLRQVGVY